MKNPEENTGKARLLKRIYNNVLGYHKLQSLIRLKEKPLTHLLAWVHPSDRYYYAKELEAWSLIPDGTAVELYEKYKNFGRAQVKR